MLRIFIFFQKPTKQKEPNFTDSSKCITYLLSVLHLLSYSNSKQPYAEGAIITSMVKMVEMWQEVYLIPQVPRACVK